MPNLAILDTDTPFPTVQQKYGLYHDIFKNLLVRAGLDLDKWSVQGYDVVTKQEYPDLDTTDAILLTGSKHDSYKDIEWINKLVEFTGKSLNQGIRVVGICFGQQIIARALGARVGVNPKGWELSSTEVRLNDIGKRIFGLPSLNIMQMHRDIVFETPPDVENLGSTEVCSIQGMYQKGSFLATQGHPEFDEFIVTELVTARRNSGLFDKQLGDKALDAASGRNDGLAIARIIVQFINGNDI